jgi:hypothetical protein
MRPGDGKFPEFQRIHATGRRLFDVGTTRAKVEMDTPEPPAITALRYTEDYGYLREAKNRSGAWWEPLKFIPLDASGRVYLTLGDEVRVRYEHVWDNQWGAAPVPDEGYAQYRALPYASLHLGGDLRLFGQLQAAWAQRSPRTITPFVDETGLDLLQAFVDWHLPVGADLSLHAGRFAMTYGSERLISFGPNIPNAFDGALLRWAPGGWRIDAFYALPVVEGFDWFDDVPKTSRKIWALYATAGHHDLYYIGFENDDAKFHSGEGHELRHTFGTRYFGDGGPWHWDMEAAVQVGAFAGDDIRAWLVALAGRHTFGAVPLEPSFGVRLSAISGDHDPGDGRLGTFDAMFPTGRYFGDITQIGPANLFTLHPVVGVELGAGVTASADAIFYWRESLDDGIYAPSLAPTRAPDGSRERYVGTKAGLSVHWQANRNLSFRAVGSIFAPGPFIETTGPAESVRYVLGQGAVAW